MINGVKNNLEKIGRHWFAFLVFLMIIAVVFIELIWESFHAAESLLKEMICISSLACLGFVKELDIE